MKTKKLNLTELQKIEGGLNGSLMCLAAIALMFHEDTDLVELEKLQGAFYFFCA